MFVVRTLNSKRVLSATNIYPRSLRSKALNYGFCIHHYGLYLCIWFLVLINWLLGWNFEVYSRNIYKNNLDQHTVLSAANTDENSTLIYQS